MRLCFKRNVIQMPTLKINTLLNSVKRTLLRSCWSKMASEKFLISNNRNCKDIVNSGTLKLNPLSRRKYQSRRQSVWMIRPIRRNSVQSRYRMSLTWRGYRNFWSRNSRRKMGPGPQDRASWWTVSCSVVSVTMAPRRWESRTKLPLWWIVTLANRLRISSTSEWCRTRTSSAAHLTSYTNRGS